MKDEHWMFLLGDALLKKKLMAVVMMTMVMTMTMIVMMTMIMTMTMIVMMTMG